MTKDQLSHIAHDLNNLLMIILGNYPTFFTQRHS